jgi:hypothetical protein
LTGTRARARQVVYQLQETFPQIISVWQILLGREMIEVSESSQILLFAFVGFFTLPLRLCRLRRT